MWGMHVKYLHYICYSDRNVQSWSELLAPLVNKIKEGSDNKPALLILLIFYLKTDHKNLTKTIENGGKYHYEINVFLKYTLDTIIGPL